jgi:hypothetical protein
MADAAVAEKPKSKRPKSLAAPIAEATPKTPKKLLVSGPKGGLGKTGCSRIIGVAASIAGLQAVFVMNRVKRSTVAFREAKKLLLKEGRLCPAEIPDLENIHNFADQGLSAVDIDNANGRDDCMGLWHFIRNGMRL